MNELPCLEIANSGIRVEHQYIRGPQIIKTQQNLITHKFANRRLVLIQLNNIFYWILYIFRLTECRLLNKYDLIPKTNNSD